MTPKQENAFIVLALAGTAAAIAAPFVGVEIPPAALGPLGLVLAFVFAGKAERRSNRKDGGGDDSDG